jgi:hypothetical protein
MEVIYVRTGSEIANTAALNALFARLLGQSVMLSVTPMNKLGRTQGGKRELVQFLRTEEISQLISQ